MWSTTVCATGREARSGFSRRHQARSDAVFFAGFPSFCGYFPSGEAARYIFGFSTTSNLISLAKRQNDGKRARSVPPQNPDRASRSAAHTVVLHIEKKQTFFRESVIVQYENALTKKEPSLELFKLVIGATRSLFVYPVCK
ncbi:hypothetical protein L596_002770 [Steinernema carpocapsae]|uniref:Uncharacterized protein n=1 Tax=Steinernema carpocapsae TaxID=34508 RepID=A0A4U8UQJ6_STECR|nr:hypothetical protein L596_002770 [Steinernema carpocapsae]